MPTIKIIDKLDLLRYIDKQDKEHSGLFIKSNKGKIFLHQGDMDGACSVYSLMMALIIEGSIKFEDTFLNAQDEKDQREAKQKLFKAFTSDLGLIRGGLSISEDVQPTLKKTFGKYVKSEYCSGIANVDSFVRNAIDKGHPCLGAFTYRGGKTGHAVCVIGYEIGDEEEMVTKIFCLDPGSNAPATSYWNAVVILNANSSASKYVDYYLCSNPEFRQEVSFDEALMIEKR